MMRRIGLLLLLSLLTGTVAAAEKAFRPGEVWPDNNGVHINCHGGGMLVHDNTFYWFGQHMIEGDAGNYAQVGMHVYSSKDLYNWKDEGIALRVSDDPKSDVAKGCILERPKVIHNHRTGKFVMWFHLETKGNGYGAARSGVAVADQPTGPYRFIESFRSNAGAWPINVANELKKPLSAEEEASVRKLHMGGGSAPNFPVNLIFRRDHVGGQMARDMTLFVDDDGTAFHIYASEDNGTLQISQLTDDYLRSAGKYARGSQEASMRPPLCSNTPASITLSPQVARAGPPTRLGWRSPIPSGDLGRLWAILVSARMRARLSMGRARMSCRCLARPRRSSSWRIGGGPATRSTEGICGCRFSSRTESRSSSGSISGT